MSTPSEAVSCIKATIVADAAEIPTTATPGARQSISQLGASSGVFRPGFLADSSPWLLLGVVVFVIALLGALYLFVRIQQSMHTNGDAERTAGGTGRTPDVSTDEDAAEEEQESADDAPESDRQVDPETRQRILEGLPEDERKILEPVLESPGLTQVDVRDRSGFSKSKVSQTVTDLEDRGLLTRERQGRTYAVYPPDDVDAIFETDDSG